jgi:very-short-patch-repair endonuclease
MTRDWDFYRRHYIAETIDDMNRVLKNAEGMTPIESIAYLVLDTTRIMLGYSHMKIQKQVEIGTYRVDFLITVVSPISSYKIVIECDGHDFHEKTKQQVSKDKKRDRYFQQNGYIVFRYSGSDIVNDPSVIRVDIMELVYPKKVAENGS